ncbi:MAG: hypothetical protein NC131_06865 [Roseburia sp.]|nr:hypothetical protein [Roseburia sp.]
MSFPFDSAAEFVFLRDGRGINLNGFGGVLDKLDAYKLSAVLIRNPFLRRIAVLKWLKEVSRVCGFEVKLKVLKAEAKPYMTEGGEVCLCRSHLKKAGYTFFALAHETAHFVLMTDPDYKLLKQIDGEYPENSADANLRSPLEYCANILTLALMQRCAAVEKRAARKEKIEKFTDALKKAME